MSATEASVGRGKGTETAAEWRQVDYLRQRSLHRSWWKSARVAQRRAQWKEAWLQERSPTGRRA